MTATYLGIKSWELTTDDYGFRTYNVTSKVSADPLDTPVNVMMCPGLPQIGAPFNYVG